MTVAGSIFLLSFVEDINVFYISSVAFGSNIRLRFLNDIVNDVIPRYLVKKTNGAAPILVMFR